ncbi:MAG: AarF/ABC1/UbiB kinase family protein [Dactylosporangium sp.]|nr:AarF/ABC1/UbiB kinase family protein [Dactylosporangium sp.]NNJ63096.1 AarF/ABC1/UbiB kinase family protein [Dactylosporangium sp.]
MTEIPKSAVVRTAKLAALPLGFAGRAALGLGKRVTGAAGEAISEDVQRRTAEHLFSVLGQLKGGAMKLGQAMSIFEAALPPDLAEPYRQVLTRLQEAAPSLPAASVHGVLAGDFGTDWRERFRSFDDKPAAAASIGQVHRATWIDGRAVAVKIQYPGAGPALVADLNQYGRLAATFRVLQPGLDIKPLVEELKARVIDELDYELEASFQRAFAAEYTDDPDIVVPQVIAAGPHTLVTEWLDGTPLSTVIASGTQKERDAAGQRIATLHFSAPARTGLLHADPHPGNFRLLPDGRLGVLDFGSTARLPDGLPEPIGRLCRRALHGDADAVLVGLRDEGFIRPKAKVDAQGLLNYIRPTVEPLAGPDFHFTRGWLRDEAARMAHPKSSTTAIHRQFTMPPSYLLIQRVTVGSVAVLCQLDAHAPYRSVVERWLPGFAEPSGSDHSKRR